MAFETSAPLTEIKMWLSRLNDGCPQNNIKSKCFEGIFVMKATFYFYNRVPQRLSRHSFAQFVWRYLYLKAFYISAINKNLSSPM